MLTTEEVSRLGHVNSYFHVKQGEFFSYLWLSPNACSFLKQTEENSEYLMCMQLCAKLTAQPEGKYSQEYLITHCNENIKMV